MSLATLRQRLTARLLPADRWCAEDSAARSDFDLNPGFEPSAQSLRAAAVLVPIIARADGAAVLLTRRADTLASHTGQIAFPGGRLDPGETAVEAALREAREEVGLDPAAVEVLGLCAGYQTGSGFLVTPVVGWLAEPPRLTPSPAEVAEVFEVPWDFLMDVANHRQDSREWEGDRRVFWAMPFGERYIWGVTAGVLKALHAGLYGDEAGRAAAAAEDAAEDVA